MATALDEFVATTTTALTDISSGLDNIQVDQAGLLQKIDALISGGGIPDAALEKLSIIRNQAVNLATRTKAIADGVPDLEPPPTA